MGTLVALSLEQHRLLHSTVITFACMHAGGRYAVTSGAGPEDGTSGGIIPVSAAGHLRPSGAETQAALKAVMEGLQITGDDELEPPAVREDVLVSCGLVSHPVSLLLMLHSRCISYYNL